MDRVRGWIEAALEGSGWTYDEIIDGCDRGDFLLWVHPEGCMVSEIIQSPRCRVMHVFAMGGSLEAAEALLPQVEACGRALGCQTGAATGRKGWGRWLKKYGYRTADFAVQKEL